MKTQKIKHYRLLIADKFPEYHPKKGENTNFAGLINFDVDGWVPSRKKIHAIVPNYRAWTKIIDEVHNGCAAIDLVYQSGKYQVIFETIDNENGCVVQLLSKIGVDYVQIYDSCGIKIRYYKIDDLAKNEGLSVDDFKSWFQNNENKNNLAIIHFTPFRY